MIEIAIKVKKVNILFNAAKLDILTWESMRIFKVDIRGTAVFWYLWIGFPFQLQSSSISRKLAFWCSSKARLNVSVKWCIKMNGFLEVT